MILEVLELILENGVGMIPELQLPVLIHHFRQQFEDVSSQSLPGGNPLQRQFQRTVITATACQIKSKWVARFYKLQA